MSLQRAFTLASGRKIPSIGLGTWQSDKGLVRAAVSTAISTGYRHIDCAWVYGNEEEVGDGIKDSGISRQKLWLTSKLWNSYHRPDLVEGTINETLNRLKTDYLDLYLMHWPVAFGVPSDGKVVSTPRDPKTGKVLIDTELTENVLPTWQALEDLVKKGKVLEIGISNFNIRRADKLLKDAKIKPAVNQVELSYGIPQPELLAWSKKSGVLLEAYSPLGSTGAPATQEPVVVDIAKKNNVSPANVLISWQVQRGAIVLPKSVTPSRIVENFNEIVLPDEDFEALEKAANAHKPVRAVDPSKGWGVDVFEEGNF